MSSKNRANCTSSFPVWITFIFLPNFPGQTLQTMLNRRGESKHLCLLLILGRKSFTIKYDITCGFSQIALYQVLGIPFYSLFVEYFYHERVLEFFMFFSVSIDMIMLFFPVFYWYSVLIDFQMLNQSCIPRINSTDRILCYWIWLASIWGYLCLYS